MTRIAESLEERARRLTENLGPRDKHLSATGVLEREIALTIDHIDGLRKLHEQLKLSLLRSECYVESDLLKLDSYLPRQYEFLFRERNKLKNKLLALAVERRRLTVTHEQEIRAQVDRLMLLLNRHAHLQN